METDAEPREPPVARKKAPPAPPRPSADRVQALFAAGDVHGAYLAARLLNADQPTADHLKLLKTLAIGAATMLESTGKQFEFNRLMAEADQIDPQDPAWIVERACLLARGGRLADALMRVDESNRSRILGYGVDRALKSRSKEFLPDELHDGFDAIVAAFKHYESGDDAAAKATLEPIGLRSPFLEWKVLLRGLIAFANGEDARAAENFARLDRGRVPYRLCSPYYATADAGYRASVPPPIAAELEERFHRLNSGGIVPGLREVAKHLGRNREMPPVFRAVEGMLHALRNRPGLLKRLGRCLYHAIIYQGQPEDLVRYRQQFGAHPDDPSFFRLQARIAEELGEEGLAIRNWLRYEEWLATKPAGWPESILNRVRAMIWLRIGSDLDDENRPGPSCLDCLRRAVQLAPDWEPASRELYVELVDRKLHEEAEAVVRALLVHQPDRPEPLQRLAAMVARQNRPDEALELYLRARTLDPLNESIGTRAACTVLAVARTVIAGKKPAAAQTLFDEHAELLKQFTPNDSTVMRAVLAKKLGDQPQLETLLNELHAKPFRRLSLHFSLAVESTLVKIKPADRKDAEQSLAAALEETPHPIEVLLLLLAYDMYDEYGITYRGQKSQIKKFLALCSRVHEAKAPEEDYEVLGDTLRFRDELKLTKKYALEYLRRFPRNPKFGLLLAEALFDLMEPPHRIRGILVVARDHAERSKEKRHSALIPRIDELLQQLPDPFESLRSFFRGGFPR